MARHTSVRVGGPAELFLVARNEEQLIAAVSKAHALSVPWRVIGSASNLLVADEGVRGLVVKAIAASPSVPPPSDEPTLLDIVPLRATTGDETGVGASPGAWGRSPQENRGGRAGMFTLEAEAGSLLAALARQTAMAGWQGLEWATNVPGTVGGAIVDNAGAFGSCVSEHLVQARVYIPGVGIRSLGPEDLGLAYRTSCLKRGDLVGVVLSATFRLTPAPVETIRAQVRNIQRLRRETQPAGFSIGSVFANPPDGFAGALIEESGLKGARVGDAEVSRLHANFILNRHRARACDVVELMTLMQRRVKERTGILLLPEVQMLGQFPRTLLEGLIGAYTLARDPVP